MEFKVSNYGKPRHKKWKLVTRFLVLSLPAYIGAVAIADIPAGPKGWIVFALSMLVATVQALSELTAEPETPKTNDNTV
jgi:hypothetical protein